MSLRFLCSLFLSILLLLITGGCKSTSSLDGQLVIGVISYGEGESAIARYTDFKSYLGKTIRAHIELEPAFNEKKALERIQNQAWDLVFAPPGIAAIAISHYKYIPLFPLQGVNDSRSILVVLNNSPVTSLSQLEGKIVALGQTGSATGYYLPIYNLYGLTLAKVLFAPTPQTVLQCVAQGKATAGALSLTEFNSYIPQFSPTKFRVLHVDAHDVPPGVVLIASHVERTRSEQIRKIMRTAPVSLKDETGYIANAVPDYQYMIAVVARVRSITPRLQQQPTRLF